MKGPRGQALSEQEVRLDVDNLFWTLSLHNVRRFFQQRFWEHETKAAEFATRIEPYPRLESVSEHSWHVADSVLLLVSNFNGLDEYKCLRMAILHDKLEAFTGDLSPVGRDGTGQTTHAFNAGRRTTKDARERVALKRYLARLPKRVRGSQQRDFEELSEGTSREARFVKAVDKLQALCFVILKKNGDLVNTHARFTIKYSNTAVEYFPELQPHYDELISRLLKTIAKRRDVSVEVVVDEILGPLPFSYPREKL